MQALHERLQAAEARAQEAVSALRQAEEKAGADAALWRNEEQRLRTELAAAQVRGD